VNVHVFVPEHAGVALGTPADGVMLFPQASVTVGGVGAMATAGHDTVDDPLGGSVIPVTEIVYVYTQL
jgi:hypothetical protein